MLFCWCHSKRREFILYLLYCWYHSKR